MSELIDRTIIATFLLTNVFLSYQFTYFYIFFLSLAFFICVLELHGNNTLVICYRYLSVYTYYLIMTNLDRRLDVLNILLYNSISDMFQYVCGKYISKYFGINHQVTSITTKSYEGYLGGIILTKLVFLYSHNAFILLNIIGMLGGLFSSYLKRTSRLKHWSPVLGVHGGVADRLDSFIIPVVFYFWLF